MKLAFGKALALTAALLFVSGCCGAAKKVKECGQMTTTINTGVTKAKAAIANPNSAGFRKLADAYEELGTNIGKLDISTADLKKDATEYQAMCKDVAKAARDAAAAEDAHNAAKLKVAQDEFQKVKTQEDALVQKINTSCH